MAAGVHVDNILKVDLGSSSVVSSLAKIDINIFF